MRGDVRTGARLGACCLLVIATDCTPSSADDGGTDAAVADAATVADAMEQDGSEPDDAAQGDLDAGSGADLGSGADASAGSDAAVVAAEGHVVYHLDGEVYRIEATAGASPVSISAALDGLALAAGEDGFVNISPDGDWLLIDSERFHADCAGWSCLVRVSADLSTVEPIVAGGQVVHVEGYAAIASAGDRIVFTAGDGPHSTDLYSTVRTAGVWSAPQLLTGASSYAFHNWPAFDGAGAVVVHTCGPQSFGDTSLCEVGVDGNGFRTLLAVDHVPPGQAGPAVALHHPDVAPDGSIVFEGDWGGELLWRLAPGASDPVAIGPSLTNDNSPCVLPDGRIASLWLNREGNLDGVHELKVMDANGAQVQMLLTDQDIFDIGLGCGR